MNIPHRITKTNYLPQDKTQSYQKTASKYFKQYQRLKKEYEPVNSVSNTKSKSTKAKIFRDEVMKWFFSLDLMTKLIVSSIENKWITCILHQLFVTQKNEPRLRFRVKEYEFFNFSNQNSANDYVPAVLKVTINENAYNSINLLPQDYLYYYHYFSKEEGYYNNYVLLNQMSEIDKSFLSEIIFYRSEEVFSEILSGKSLNSNMNKYSNYFTLSEKILQDENSFKFHFNHLSNNSAFNYLIDSSYDQTSKNYNICLPNWINNREYYSLAEVFAAFFEQVISVRFVLFKQNQNECLNQKTHWEFVNKEREELLKFMNKNLPINEIHNKLKVDEIVTELYSDKIIEEFYVNRFHRGDKESFVMANYYKYDNEILFDKVRYSIEDLKRNIQIFIKKFRNQKEFLNFLIFIPIEKIFTFDDFLFRKFYEALLNLRSRMTAMDLINELEVEEENETSEKIGERKKSESLSNANNTIKSNNAGIGSVLPSGGKVNKKKKKKRGSNPSNTVINANINAQSGNVGNFVTGNNINNEKKLENNPNQSNKISNYDNNKIIVPSADLDHVILEIRNDNVDVDEIVTDDIEKNLNSYVSLNPTNNLNYKTDIKTKNEISFTDHDREKIQHNTIDISSSENTIETIKIETSNQIPNQKDKRYAFSFIKRKKNNNEQIDAIESKENSQKSTNEVPKNSEMNSLMKENSSKNLNNNPIVFSSGEFMGSIMLIKQKSENQLEKTENPPISMDVNNSKLVHDLRDEIITKVCLQNETKEKTLDKTNLLKNLNHLDSLPKKSICASISEKLDQNDIDTAYSSDGNKSESAESKLMKSLQGKNKKRMKENKFFLYNIKESNLTGYKHKNEGNDNNLKVKTNKNENRKLSQPSGEKDTQKILKQIIEHHFENKKEIMDISTNPECNTNSHNEENYLSFNNLKNKSTFTNNSILNKNKVFKNEERENNELNEHLNNTTTKIEKIPDKNDESNLISINAENNLKTINQDNIKRVSYNENHSDNTSPHNYKINRDTFYNTLNSSKTLNYNNFKESFIPKYNGSKFSSHNPILDMTNTHNFHNFNQNKDLNNNNFKHYKYFMEKPNKSNFFDSNIPMINPISNVNSVFYSPIPSYNNPHFYNSFMNPINPIKPFAFPPFISNDYLIPPNSHHNPLSFDLFHMKIQRDIFEFSESVDKNLSQLKPIKIFTISYLENIIKKFLEKNQNSFNAEIELYGSFASELAIESSDIDITIKLTNDSCNDGEILAETSSSTDIISFMSCLVENFKALGIFEIINPIYTATVPVVKLVVDPTSILDEDTKQKLMEFKKCEAYKNYNFNRDDLDKIRVDLTFSDLSSFKPASTRQNPNIIDNKNITQLHLDYINESLQVFPELKPLIQILKRFLQINKLHCSFNGGLSSFSLFLLLLAHVKINRLNFSMGFCNNSANLGKLFIDFFLFYGNLFEFNYTVIDVNMDNPFILCSQPLDAVPTILDPITYLNAGKSSYRTIDIKQNFSSAFEKLNEMKILFEKKQGIIHENFVNVLLRTEIKSNL